MDWNMVVTDDEEGDETEDPLSPESEHYVGDEGVEVTNVTIQRSNEQDTNQEGNDVGEVAESLTTKNLKVSRKWTIELREPLGMVPQRLHPIVSLIPRREPRTQIAIVAGYVINTDTHMNANAMEYHLT
ncbi:hypothetical protein GCK72_000944 [Caenorhabditis remanei]|uniref:Uncharacterized protein n=1 Tax=Caenorhabditis remanei TaxID=31234 RepID=A0A6A5HLQ3_CAERE|nr:hypothetical protein GCK72_000944 [Caenorhabditis remanei]KAF1769130.1 hypothetical protein GCK72_000944 [Caenorhabditis remanei]